ASRTLLRDRLVRRREIAFRIARAAVEIIAAARFLFDDFAFLALRTLHANEVLLDPLALRISRAGNEFAVAAMAQHQAASALRTFFVERNIGDLLCLVEPPRGLALRVSGTGHELA